MDRLTNRLLVLTLPLVGFTLLGRGLVSSTSGVKSDVRAVASPSTPPAPSLSSSAPSTAKQGKQVVKRPQRPAGIRRQPPIATRSSKFSQPALTDPSSSPKQKAQRLDDLPQVERLDSLPEVERLDRLPEMERLQRLPDVERLEGLPEVAPTYSESKIHSMYRSMVEPTEPTMLRTLPLDDTTLFAKEDSQSASLGRKQKKFDSPAVAWAVQPTRRREEPASTSPLELINPHLKAAARGADVHVARSSAALMRLPPPESASPDATMDRPPQAPKSPTLTTGPPGETAREIPEDMHVNAQTPMANETSTGRSLVISDGLSMSGPVVPDVPTPAAADDSRFASRYAKIPAASVRLGPEQTGSPRRRDRDASFHALPVAKNGKNETVKDEGAPWSPVELRTMELSGDRLQLAAPAPHSTGPHFTDVDKKRAQEAIRLGFELARRRSFDSSHARFIEALQIVAQWQDELALADRHTVALRRGLQAYVEAADFQAWAGHSELDMNLNSVVSRHDTPVLRHVNLADWNREQCLREYMSYAEDEIVRAVGREPIAARALYGLGRLQTHLQAGRPESQRVGTHRALMLYQAALLVDERHYSAANELGVLLARHGQLEEAVAALQHCVRLSPQPTAWRNLAVVHSRLGQAELARLASEEARMAKQRPPQPAGALP